MFFSHSVKATIIRVYPLVATLHKGSDEDRRKATRITIEQIVYEHPGQGWGWKSASPSSPPSKDAIALKVGDRLYSWDHIDGATRELKLGGKADDITGHHFIVVEGKDHLGTPQPPPDNPPQPSPDHEKQIAELQEQLKLQKQVINDLVTTVDSYRKRIELLEKQPLPRYRVVPDPESEGKPISTSKTWGHGHNIRVKVEPIE